MTIAWIVLVLLVVLIVFPYTFYPLILSLLPKKQNNEDKGKIPESVTLYIAAYNEEKVIAEKLENSLRLKTNGIPFEIVVGSDGSTDQTNAIVESYAKKYPNIRLLNFTDRQGKVNVLNRGIPLCKGEIILLSDANAMYNPECLTNILPHFQNESVGCVSGEKRIIKADGMINANEGLYWKLEAKIKSLEAKVKTVIGADGACYAIRKKLFVSMPKDTSVDDFLLSMKIVEQGYTIDYEPRSYSGELTGQTQQQELKRKIRIAAGNFFNLHLLRSFLKPSLLSFMFIAHKVLRWTSPIYFIVMTILLGYMAVSSQLAFVLLILLLATYSITIWKFKGTINKLTNNKLTNIFSYFYLTVWAQLLGYKQYKQKRQGAIWDTVRE